MSKELKQSDELFVLKCKKCKKDFKVNFVDYPIRENLKGHNIECINQFSRWLRAVESANFDLKLKYDKFLGEDVLIGIKVRAKTSLCYTCYFDESYILHKNNLTDEAPSNEWLDGSYIK